ERGDGAVERREAVPGAAAEDGSTVPAGTATTPWQAGQRIFFPACLLGRRSMREHSGQLTVMDSDILSFPVAFGKAECGVQCVLIRVTDEAGELKLHHCRLLEILRLEFDVNQRLSFG
ncbi:MAG: hypothetical protein KDA85_16755, partial [Planctomycetaceae bacterium]|nr:hypothetical protein [Planctomycetaceae bacterium]